MLGPAAYGAFAALVAAASLVAYAVGPFSAVVAQLTVAGVKSATPEAGPAVAGALLRRLAIGAALAAVPAVIFGRQIADYWNLGGRMMPLFAVALVFLLIGNSIVRAVLRGSQHFSSYAWNMLAEACLRLGIGIGAMLLIPSPTAAISAYVMSGSMTLLWAGRQARVTLERERRPVVRRQFGELIPPLLLLSVGVAAFQNLDLLIVRRFCGAEESGSYAAAQTIARSFAVIVMPFEAMLIPMIARRRLAQDSRRTTLWFVSVFLLIGGGTLAAFNLAPQQIVHLLYGRRFDPASAFLVPLATAQVMAWGAYLAGHALVALQRSALVWWYLPPFIFTMILFSWSTKDALSVARVMMLGSTLTSLVMAAALAAALLTDENRSGGK